MTDDGGGPYQKERGKGVVIYHMQTASLFNRRCGKDTGRKQGRTGSAQSTHGEGGMVDEQTDN